MIERMTHKEYVQSVRGQAVELASNMIAGTFPILEGCHALASLRSEVDVDESDEDFVTFAMISSETDALPAGDVRARWAAEALARMEPDIQSAIAWATPQALLACQSVVRRFGA
jgi:hypothetical protein